MGLFDRLFGNKKQKKETQSAKEAPLQETVAEESQTTPEEQEAKPSIVTNEPSGRPEPEGHFEPEEKPQSVHSEQGSTNKADAAKQVTTEEPAEPVAKPEPEPVLKEAAIFAVPGDFEGVEPELAQTAKTQTSEPVPLGGTSDATELADVLEPSNTPANTKDDSTEAATEPSQTAPAMTETEEDKYKRSLSKTRSGFSARLNSFFATFRKVDEDFFEELEEMLILSDVGVTVATELTDALRQEAKIENAKKPEALKRVIIEKLVAIYEKDGTYKETINLQPGLTVMLFVGVNGVGKTTSIGKLAYKYKQEGKKVMLVAADTFRAGAVAQLAEWGRRVAVPVVTGPEKADPASVVFDGVEKAVAEKIDVLMIDTAGRLQNKENLMAELEKIGRIIKRVVPDAPHETLLALDASTGQNALSQAKEFSKITPLTGLILTKIDGTAKGGVVLAIRQELDIPVKLIGFGEKIDDIGVFNSEEFMRGLLTGIL
ncbi:signal recognition particle-docking protein FtsY [Streptococcus halichoeri]|uniref:signal recognition particle-docking protein FtsY n=1 Tax=Streptococcus halichoeri TaxID=254785 RepID=UPI00135C5C46|nr:signal recognition particle-docking protein FtsY [Streptococcus halichoeri]